MTKIERSTPEPGLDRLVSECFRGGELRRRELRLTAEQARLAAEQYPVSLRPMGGSWYEITFQGAYRHGS